MAVNYGHFSKFFEAHFYLLLLHWDDWTWTMNVMFHPFSLVRVPTIIFFLEKITNSTVKTWILSRVRQLKNWTSRFPKMEFLFLSVGDDTISFPKGWNHLPPSSVHFECLNIRKVFSVCLEKTPPTNIFVRLLVVKNCNNHVGLPFQKNLAPNIFSFERWNDAIFFKGLKQLYHHSFLFFECVDIWRYFISVPSEKTPKQKFLWGFKWWKTVL